MRLGGYFKGEKVSDFRFVPKGYKAYGVKNGNKVCHIVFGRNRNSVRSILATVKTKSGNKVYNYTDLRVVRAPEYDRLFKGQFELSTFKRIFG